MRFLLKQIFLVTNISFSEWRKDKFCAFFCFHVCGFIVVVIAVVAVVVCPISSEKFSQAKPKSFDLQ
jgi:hypothetical protein